MKDITDLIENDLDIMFEQLLSCNNLKTMQECLEMCRSTYRNYEEYFARWEEAQHKYKLEFEN